MTKIISTESIVTPTLVIGLLGQFLEEMQLIPFGPIYRDATTGRFVKAGTVLDLFARWGRPSELREAKGEESMPEMDYQDSPTGVNSQEEEEGRLPAIFQPLPDWGSMKLEEILDHVTYGRKVVEQGVSTGKKVRMTRKVWRVDPITLLAEEVDEIIPVAKGGDGGEYTKFGSKDTDDAEDVYLKTAEKARKLLIEWEENAPEWAPIYRVVEIDQEINRVLAGLSDGSFHPYQDGEEVANHFYRLLVVLPKKEQERRRKEAIAFLQEKCEQWGLIFEEIEARAVAIGEQALIDMGGVWDMDIASEAVRSGFKSWTRAGGSWSIVDHTPMGCLVLQFHARFGEYAKFNGAPLHKSELVRKAISGLLWQSLASDPRPMHEAVKGTIGRYVSSMLMVKEGMEILSDRQRREIGIDSAIASRTPWSAIRKGPEEWAWQNRVVEEWER